MNVLKEAFSQIAKRRWKKTPKKKRQEIARNLSNTRWEKWRVENPEKAAASEGRRRKRKPAK